LGRLRRCVAEGRSDAPGPVVDTVAVTALSGVALHYL
jgi:hypothetical protein